MDPALPWDVDGDGKRYLIFAGLETGNALYRNPWQLRFEEAAAASGVVMPGASFHGSGVFADVDGDRDPIFWSTPLGRNATVL